MIERHWKGIAHFKEADNYIKHLTLETFPHLATIQGFVRSSILNRETGEGVEFLIVTVWQSLDAIKQFAGEQAEIAVVPPTVQNMMVSYDPHVSHYSVVLEYKP